MLAIKSWVNGRVVLAFVFGMFCLAFYSPLSSKAVNNIFYVGLALPMLVWVMVRPKALWEKMYPLSWFFALLALMVVLDAGDWADLKKVLYLSMFFFCLLYLSSRYWFLHGPLLLFSAGSVGILLFTSFDWLLLGVESGRWARYGYFLGEAINPVYFSLLVGFALLYLWMFYMVERLETRSRLLLLAGIFVLSLLQVINASVFQSRSTLLGYALFLVCFLFFKRMFWLGIGVTMALFALGVLVGIDDLLLQRGLSYRLDIWQAALQRLYAECSLWWGCGRDQGLLLGRFYHPHSGYVAMLYRNGLIGAVLLVVFAVLYLRNARREGRPWLLLSLFGWGSLFTTTSGVFTTPQPLWIYVWLPTFMAIIAGQRVVVHQYLLGRSQSARS